MRERETMTLHRRVSAVIGVASDFVKFTFRMVSFFGRLPNRVELFPASGRNAREKFRKTQIHVACIVGGSTRFIVLCDVKLTRHKDHRGHKGHRGKEENAGSQSVSFSVFSVASVVFVMHTRRGTGAATTCQMRHVGAARIRAGRIACGPSMRGGSQEAPRSR
jgi:hypothetical protein